MEAAPRLGMIHFDLKISTENVAFAAPLKQYIQSFYNEDPESYSTEINNLQALRAAATHPTIDVEGCETLRKYYCQLHFLKARFPMEEGQPASMHFFWKDSHTNLHCTLPDIRFEMMCILYNIGALHTQLGAMDARTTPEGMKMACTHFQCAAWCYQTIKENFTHLFSYGSVVYLIHYMQLVCLGQAQECILEKSMLDNRNATCIAKVAVQVVEYYRSALFLLQSGQDETPMQDLLGSKVFKDWVKYLSFKIAYHKCISHLFQGQQAEEQQKMGERVAFYQAACEYLDEARKLASGFKNQQEIAEGLGFTMDVVEGKRKAAKNENEFIYHEEVPSKDVLQQVKGASLVNGIAFNVNDPEVSGSDIFARLVPMEAHEAASLYSEKKAETIRQLGELIDSKDQQLVEFISSMQLDFLSKLQTASGIPQEIVDRAAAMNARPNACKDLIDSMGKLSNTFHEVESMLKEIDAYLKEEETSEKEYQDLMGKRPPSIIATDLSREAAKYREAHNKANDSNQTLHRAMTAHVANLKILSQPLRQLQQQLPSFELQNNPNVDQAALNELESLVAKVDEMRTQRAMLWAQYRDNVQKDDITGILVTKQPEESLDQVFQQALQKHQKLSDTIKQNAAAQENIKKAVVEAYAKSLNTRRYVQDIIQKRQSTINSLIASYDSYDDLLAKAQKGIEFYSKLETNVTKLLQRIKGACKVQQEEREQHLSKTEQPKVEVNVAPSVPAAPSSTPKLKDYLEARKKPAAQTYPVNYVDPQAWPPGVRPAPLGSEVNDPLPKAIPQEAYNYNNMQYYNQAYGYSNNPAAGTEMYTAQNPSCNPTDPLANQTDGTEQDLSNRMKNLLTSNQMPQYSYSSYTPQNYPTYSYANPQSTPSVSTPSATPQSYNYDPTKAFTSTTNSYQPISSHTSTGVNPTASFAAAATSEVQAPTAGTFSTTTPQVSANTAASYDAQQYYAQYNQGNTYYPHGYAPGYTNPTTQAEYSATSYHSNQYSTSVRPDVVNKSNTTYSSPTIETVSSNGPKSDYNIATSQGYNPNYQQYGYQAQTSADGQTGFTNYGYYAYNQQQPYNTTGYYNNNQNQAGYTGQQQGSYTNVAATAAAGTQDYQPIGQQASLSNVAAYNSASPTTGLQNYNIAQPQVSSQSSGSNVAAYNAGAAQGTQNYPNQQQQLGQQSNISNTAAYNNTSATNYNSAQSQIAPQQQHNRAQPQVSPQTSGSNVAAYNAAQGTQNYPNQQQQIGQQSNLSNAAAYNNTSATNYNSAQSQIAPQQQQHGNVSNVAGYNSTTAATQNYAGQQSQIGQQGTLNNATAYNSTTGLQNYPSQPQNYAMNQQSQQVYNNTAYSGQQTVPTTNLQPQTITNNTVSQPKKESNLDLLSGLDFTINQAPLVPQQPTVKQEPEPIIQAVESAKIVEEPKIVKPQPKIVPSKPLNNEEVRKLFKQELDKYEKFVEMLPNKTLNGPTNLELKWKEIQDVDQKKAISVARCYPMKNRFPDILPYDACRVELSDTKDDYINASYIKDVSPFAPLFIVTQAPLQGTLTDFWTMVRQQQVELVFCLLNDSELGSDVYFPREKGSNLMVSNMVISLQSVIVKTNWTERLISISVPERRESWTLMHLQFTTWPGSLFPTIPEPFIDFTKELIGLYQQQKNPLHPIVVHCSSSIGRAGLLPLLTTAILDVTNNSTQIPDLAFLAMKLSNCQKNILRDREHLKFAYEAWLCYMKQVVNLDRLKLNEIVPQQDKVDVQPVEIKDVKVDPLSSLDPFWASR